MGSAWDPQTAEQGSSRAAWKAAKRLSCGMNKKIEGMFILGYE